MIAYNRPQHLQKVFERVQEVKPARLYIAVDGPRENNEADIINITKSIAVFDQIDWPCDVKKLIRKKNFGCKMAVSGAISWFFENEEFGIILEDDCLPDISFFSFAAHMLERYKNVDSIMHINGVNFQDGNVRSDGAYYFSKICHVWGWASWRRAWQKYDLDMRDLENFFDKQLYRSIINYKGGDAYWRSAFFNTRNGLIDTWDYQWVYSVWKNNGLSISPQKNLVVNIGFDRHATHTKKVDANVSNMKLESLFDFEHDVCLKIPNYQADRYSFLKLFKGPSKFRRSLSWIKRKILG